MDQLPKGPEDVEFGDEPVQVRRGRRAGIVVSVRFSPEEAEEVLRFADEHDMWLTEVARAAVMRYVRARKASPMVSKPSA